MAVKKQSTVDWEDVRVFTVLARVGSLSAAARVLGVTHATVARRVKSLETRLGGRLVERRTDGYQLTEAGRHVLQSASEMEVASSRLERAMELDSRSLRGRIRISAPPSLTHCFFAQVLSAIALQNPLLEIEVSTDFRVVSLERREADIAIRLGRPVEGGLIARELGAVRFGFYGTDAWRERMAAGASPSFVTFDEQNLHLPEAAWLAASFPRATVAMRASSQVLQAQAAAAGLGIAVLPDVVAAAFAPLVRVPLPPEPPPRELWLVRHRADRGNSVVKAVWDALSQAFAQEPRYFIAASAPGSA